jgi:hypothetical protein
MEAPGTLKVGDSIIRFIAAKVPVSNETTMAITYVVEQKLMIALFYGSCYTSWEGESFGKFYRRLQSTLSPLHITRFTVPVKDRVLYCQHHPLGHIELIRNDNPKILVMLDTKSLPTASWDIVSWNDWYNDIIEAWKGNVCRHVRIRRKVPLGTNVREGVIVFS